MDDVPADGTARDRWRDERTTFQRVYDVLVGAREFLAVEEFAERAACSENGAREALEQLAEMGVARRRDGRPARYRRNDSYLTWKRVESLARDRSPEELRERVAELDAEDRAFRDEYGVSDPDAVSTADVPVGEHEAVEDRWDDLHRWRTVRRDVRILRRAVERAEARRRDGASA